MLPKEVVIALENYWIEEGLAPEITKTQSIGGGSINQAFLVQTSSSSFFLKYNSAQAHPLMFSSELQGLQLLNQTQTIRIPQAYYAYEGNEYSFILMEYIEQKGYAHDFWEQFAQDLAHLHTQSASSFGLVFPNYMGNLSQSNIQHSSFTEFFIEERLEPQIRMARNNGSLSSKHSRQAENLYSELDSIFPSENPSLVHGDLWSGNFMSDETGHAVIIDPAVYFGHREVDIAMTTMFGGFSTEFYEFYQKSFPMEKGWQERIPFYNLYPILIHINLFGESYLGEFERVLNKF